MSLINEALRRTRDAAQQDAGPGQPSYRLEPAPAKPTGPGPARLILTVVFSLIALGGLLYATYRFASFFPRARMDYMPATKTPPPAGPEGLPPHLRPTVPAPALEPAPAPVTPPPAPVAEPAPAPKPVEVAPPPSPAELPKLEIQGFSNVGSVREVMINGRTLRVGDTILGVKILSIERPVVRVWFDGREIELARP